MTNDELDRALSVADPLRGLDEQAFDFALAEEELLTEILETPRAPISGRTPGIRRWRPLRVAAAFACVVALALVVLVVVDGSNGGGGGGGSAYAAEAVRVAEANRRLLVSQRGWRVDYARWESPTYGEVDFVPRGGMERGFFDMHWFPEDELAMRTKQGGDPVEVAGVDGVMYPEGSGEFVAVLPPSDGSFLMLRGLARDADDFRTRLASIVAVDVDTWLGAMPASVVKPVDQGTRIDELLQGVSLPEGFDRSTIELASLPQDDYQLTAFVTRGVTCAWLDQWNQARKSGDTAAEQQAVTAMAGASEWPAVRNEPALVEDYDRYAVLMRQGLARKDVYDQEMDCIEYP